MRSFVMTIELTRKLPRFAHKHAMFMLLAIAASCFFRHQNGGRAIFALNFTHSGRAISDWLC
jgi:hypothetical protein